MWITPKTDWKATDNPSLADYSRIRGNMEYLHGMARRLYPLFGLLPMSDYAIDGLPYLEFYANIEGNLARLYGGTLPRPQYSTRVMQENDSVWDFRDLNRIEGILQQMRDDLLTQEIAKLKLSFKLGGGAFAAFL